MERERTAHCTSPWGFLTWIPTAGAGLLLAGVLALGPGTLLRQPGAKGSKSPAAHLPGRHSARGPWQLCRHRGQLLQMPCWACCPPPQ